MRLFIAEKPSLGRAIADGIGQSQRKHDGYIELANGDCVSWCIGHLLEQAEPEVYNPDFAKWRLEHLPITPEQWQLKPKPKTKKQLSVIRKLIKQADQLVHAGDPDREGQLLVDQVLVFAGASKSKRQHTQRCLISDLNVPAVQRALSNLRSNQEFVALSTSALARSRADWLYGINMTRAYTLQGQKVGYQGVLSVGRVQTPLLGLVVRRDAEIADFISKPFYEVLAHINHDEIKQFKAKWQPSESCADFMDEEDRVLSLPLVENVAKRITDQPAEVERCSDKSKSQAPPLPYNLSSLQIDAAKIFGLSAKVVLDVCQSLYEKHKLITYPRSDSRYLPLDHFQQRQGVVDAIAKAPAIAPFIDRADLSLKSKAWNDSKVEAHHAIAPTSRNANIDKLSKAELNVYQLVAKQYLAQFFAKHVFTEREIHLRIAGGLFVAKQKQVTEEGWKVLFKSKKEQTVAALPKLSKKQILHCTKGEVEHKQTQPPKAFTDATLLAAMTGVARFVQDPETKKVLRETDGLGTEATRAGIIELLFQRSFLQRQGKQIHATEAGNGLIASLPASATYPDMTARWESNLALISEKKLKYDTFMAPLLKSLSELIEQSRNGLPMALKGIQARQPKRKKRRGRRAKLS